MHSELPPAKRVRTEVMSSNSPYNFFSRLRSSNDSTANTKPVPSDFAEFLSDPYRFRLTDEFFHKIQIDDNESPLTHCIKVQNIKAVDVLLKYGVDPNVHNKKGVSPISAAAHKGNIPIMQLLIKAGAVVNAVNQSGSTALIQAAHFGHLDAVKLLLNSHANADFANVKGTTALMRASQEGHVDIARALLKTGVDVNRRNHEGMNALMLASQRGHADIVYLLIEAGAVMDEQTAQGSTALMLACKRGHEKCAEALVTMGAEIYMRDRRARTARDTALRRNHTNLLRWLDTQIQIMKIQEIQLKLRSKTLFELRNAYLNGKLELCLSEQFIYDLLLAIKIKNKSNFYSQEKIEKSLKFLENFENNFELQILPFFSKTPTQVISEIEMVMSGKYQQMSEKVVVIENCPLPAKRVVDYAEWMWVQVLYKTMSLPNGVFEHIMDYLPMPRVWPWSLSRMPRRCKLAPQQAVNDMSIIMDDILKDACIIHGNDQKNLLMKIHRAPQLTSLLINYHQMPPSLVESIDQWADIQSLIHRSNEVEVTIKYPFARRMLHATIQLYRWYRCRNNSHKYLNLNTIQSQLTLQMKELTNDNLKLIGQLGSHTNEVDLLEATDAGNEDPSDNDDDDDGIVFIEPDTETEFINNPNDEILDDSDNDNNNY